jgi:glycosyltransferase involved in cell wall biosynthesis/radical SAM superfamily enzyme YgiQ (UPF0313 family)
MTGDEKTNHVKLADTAYVGSTKQPRRVLLTTSAAPAQSPFSTKEKRPPLGIGFLISILQNAGHKVFFIDNYLQPTNFLETDYLQQNEIAYVGIYANTICFRDTLAMLHKLQRTRQSGKWQGKIIVGGPHTAVASHTIPDFVDFVVQGEGEQAILDIVEGRTNERVLCYHRIKDLDILPMPAWDYFVGLPYDWGIDFFDDKPVFTMNTSRGCPFNCTFCSVGSIWGRQYTYFSAQRIVSDIEYLIAHYGAKGIYFREDNFTFNQNRLREFCNLLIEKGISVPWACESRVSNLNRELVELMSRAGARGFYFGVESGSQRILDLLQKNVTIEQIKNAFEWCREFGIKTAASVIVGVPGQTESDLFLTGQLLKELNPTVTWFNVFVGIPDSKLYRFSLNNRLYQYIDDRGLVYLQGHNSRARQHYGAGWNAYIPDTEERKDWTTRPKVSVLFCVCNGQRFLRQALQSIYNQTFQDFEVVIVDDASTDNTPDILLEMKDSRTVIYRNSQNQGLTKSLNIGLKLCRGEYIARMDADDISDPQRFEKQVKSLDQNPDCLVVGTWCRWIDSDGKPNGGWQPPAEYEGIRRKLLVNNSLVHGSVMLRRVSLVKAGGYDEKYEYAQDYDLWLRLSEVGQIRNIPEHLYNLRSWAEAASIAKKDQQDKFAKAALREACKRRGIVCVEESSPKLSVVLTTYNRPNLLEKTLAGFISQTAPKEDFEVIVIDDGSQPPVKDVADKFRSSINIRYIYQQNSGLAAARNKGIKAAKGRLVLFSDDDDVPSPELIAEHLRSHGENPDQRVAVLGHLDWHQDLQVTPLMHYVSRVGGEYFCYNRLEHDKFYEVWKWWGGLVSAKLSLLKSLEGPFDERLRFGYEDTELVCRLMPKGVRILYNANAKSFILRPIDFESFCKRRVMQGRALYVVARAHPELIIPRYQLQDAAGEYYNKYAPFLDEWTKKVIQFESFLKTQSHTQVADLDKYLKSLYIVYGHCFRGCLLKGYVEQMEAVEGGRVTLSEPVAIQLAISNCHPDPERAAGESHGEGSGFQKEEILRSFDFAQDRCAQNDTLLRITFISDVLPVFDRTSANLRIYRILQILINAGHKLDYLYFKKTDNDDKYKKVFDGAVNFVFLSDCGGLRPDEQPTLNSFIDYFNSNRIHQVDYVWITNLWDTDYSRFAIALSGWLKSSYNSTQIIIDTMDFHYKKLIRKFNVSHDDKDLSKANQFLEIEKQLYPLADRVLTVTEAEKRDILDSISEIRNVTVIPNIHTILSQTPDFQQRNNICFLGALHIAHNTDAVRWFLKQVFPLIIHSRPDLQFHILGFNAERFRAEFEANPNVKVVGYVKDVEAAVADYKVFVCPMIYGAGMKGKLGIAAAAGTPIVTTEIGAEGFDFVDGQNCFIANDPQQFAQKCLHLLSDVSLWKQFSTKAREMLAEKFSIEAVTAKIHDLFQPSAKTQTAPQPIVAAATVTQPSACSPVSKPITRPKVSIITSCYNCEKFLSECIDSIRNQTLTDWELFLLDDASTDRTRNIIERYAAMDGRIRPYYFQENKGPYIRRNFAIERANSDFIVIQDADDNMCPAKLQTLYDAITSDECLAVVGSFYRTFIDEFNGLEYADRIDLPVMHDEILEKYSSTLYICWHGSAIIRKTMFDAIGLYDDHPYGSDKLWLAKAAEYALCTNEIKFKNVPEYLTLKREHLMSQQGLLPYLDPRNRRAKFQTYWMQKFLQIREKVRKDPAVDIKAELRNCKCGDFIQRYGRLFQQWESEPLDNNYVTIMVGRAAKNFNQHQNVTCITTLDALEIMVPSLPKNFKDFDFLCAKAYFAIDKKEHCLKYLEREIQNHDNSIAKQFLADHFENQQHATQAKVAPGASPAQISPLVSVIMPAYNADKFIEKAIRSILAQDHRDFELIIINDGSTDRTEDKIRVFKDKRITYLFQENKGLASAHNLGIKNSKGAFLIKLDSDDMMTPDFISKHLQEFDKHPEADLIYCDDCLIDENDNTIHFIKRPEYSDRKLFIRDLFRCGYPVVPFRTCIRKSVFDKIGLFDEKLLVAEDYDMIRRFVQNGLKAHHLKGSFYLRRMTRDSLSANSTEQKAKHHFEVFKRFTETFRYDELFPDVQWDKVAPDRRQVWAKCLAAVTCLSIGSAYIKSNSPQCAKTAFNLACSELEDCLQIDPANRILQQLLRNSQLIRARFMQTEQQAVCQPV